MVGGAEEVFIWGRRGVLFFLGWIFFFFVGGGGGMVFFSLWRGGGEFYGGWVFGVCLGFFFFLGGVFFFLGGVFFFLGGVFFFFGITEQDSFFFFAAPCLSLDKRSFKKFMNVSLSDVSLSGFSQDV